MRKIERFDKYMKYKGLNDNKVTVQLKLSVGTLGKSRKEGRDLSDKVIELILNFYNDLDRVWLLTGEGSMLKKFRPSANRRAGRCRLHASTHSAGRAGRKPEPRQPRHHGRRLRKVFRA